MDAIQKISTAATSFDDWHQLDKLHVPYASNAGGPALKFGLACELYLSNDRTTLRQYTALFLTDYAKLFSSRVNRFMPTEKRRAVKFNNDLKERLEKDFEQRKVEDGYGAAVFGAVDIGLHNDDIDPYQAHVLICREKEVDLSYFRISLPNCDNDGKANFELLKSVVLRWAAAFKPAHGGAGLSFIYASGMSQNSELALQFMKRFPGFDFSASIRFTSEARAIHDRIKCVNWLTILGDEIVNQIGGVEKVKSVLEPACTIHQYDGGVVIQAGKAPQIGDTLKNDIPKEYRSVAQLTKPVRFEEYEDYLFRVPNGLDDRAESLAWIRRFD